MSFLVLNSFSLLFPHLDISICGSFGAEGFFISQYLYLFVYTVLCNNLGVELTPGQAGNVGEVQADNEVPACTLPGLFESLHVSNTSLLQGAVFYWVKILVNAVSSSFFPLCLEQDGLPCKEIDFSLWLWLHKHSTYSFTKAAEKTQVPKLFCFVSQNLLRAEASEVKIFIFTR